MTLHRLVVTACRRLAGAALTHPWLTLVLGGLAPLLAAPGLWRLQLRTDGHALVSARAPEVQFDASIRRDFGVQDQIVVLIRTAHPDGIYNPRTIQLVRELTAELSRLPGINPSNVTSLATEPSFRLRPGTLHRQTLLEPPLKTRAELEQLREDIRRIQLYPGTIVGFDERSTGILLGAPGAGDRTRLHRALLERIAARGPTADEIHITGAPVAESLLGIHILEDLGLPRALLGTTTWARSGAAADASAGPLTKLRQRVARSLGLLPLTIALMLLVFLLVFRNPLAALLPMPEVGAAIVSAFGLMGYCGVPVYLTIAVMPVLLTAMCVTDEIHVFSRYFALAREQPHAPVKDRVRQVVDEMCCPVANSSLTTAIGFGSFACSSLPPVRAFGIFTALGMGFALVWSLTVIPALLVLIPPRWLRPLWGRPERSAPTGTGAAFSRLGAAVIRHRPWVLGGVGLLVALSPLGLRRLVVQDSWIDGFDPTSEFRQTTAHVNAQFHGIHLLLVSFDASRTLRGEIPPAAVTGARVSLPRTLCDDPRELAGASVTFTFEPRADSTEAAAATPIAPAALTVWRTHFEFINTNAGGIVALTPADNVPPDLEHRLRTAGRIRYEITAQPHLRPAVIRQIAALSEHIRQRRDCAVGGVIGPAEFLTTTRFMVRPSDPHARALPANADETKLMWDFYRMVRGAGRLRQIVDTNYARSLITVFLKDANFVDTARLMRDLRDYERHHLTPEGIRLGFAGDVAVSQSLIAGIVSTQLRSLLGALAGIYLLVSLLGRSWRWGLYCVVPSALAVLINFTVMGWCDIPLGVATSMFAGMTLGLGVDFAIHLLEGLSLARHRGLAPGEAVGASLRLTGPAVLVNTLAICAGFGVLMLSQVPANARLGLLVALGLVDCLLASLLLLPVLLERWPLRGAPDQTT